jgi:hypothetical protein
MNFRTVLPLAVVLTKSQLRGTQRGKFLARLISNPKSIIVLDGLFVIIFGVAGYFVISNVPQDLAETFGQLEIEALIGIPAITTFMLILFGVLSELSQPIQSTSTDLVNWLPISPSEYVVGSTISLSYTYSIILAFFLGTALGPAVYYGHGLIFVISAMMGSVSLFIGSTAVELLRAVTNRISSSFYKKSGRSGIFVRLSLTITAFVLFQLLFSGQVMVTLLNSLTQTIAAVWYVPVMWPSLAVQTFSKTFDFTPLGYGLLSLGFVGVLFALAIGMRKTYWVPIPVSIRLSTQPYRASFNRFRIPGLDVAEAAIIRKDLRSLTRRREMARFLAIPFVLAASLWISTLPFGSSSEGPDFTVLVLLYLIPIAIFCEILSMTSIGQEGSAVWNLYAAPIDANKLARAKMLLTILLGTIFTCALLIAVAFLSKQALTEFVSLLLLGLIVVIENSALGVCIAGRFPDFRETVRSRYVSLWASLLGTFLGLAVACLTAAIILLADSLQTLFPLTLTGMAIGLLVFAALAKLATRQVKRLLTEIQV